MHLHFVFPRWTKLLEGRPELRDTLSGYRVGKFEMAGLGVATAAGAVPPGHRVSFVDDNVEPVDTQLRPDLVCLSFFTPQASRAYAIADAFRERGVPVIAGGIHPTMLPEETLEHCDAVMEGPVEGSWEGILDDLAGGALKRRYTSVPHAGFARPRRDLFERSRYIRTGIMQTARGCSYRCGYCVVPGCYGAAIAFKPIDQVLGEIATLQQRSFFFGDENLLFDDDDNRAYRTELLTAMADRGVTHDSFMASFPRFVTALTDDDLALMARARVRQLYLVLGLDKPLRRELRDPALVELLARAQRHRVRVMVSFTLGHDGDVEPVEPLIGDFCRRVSINLAEFVLSTPFPGTEMYRVMQRSGRLLHRDWQRYNAANVVFEPLHESPASLDARYLDCWRGFYGRLSRARVHGRYLRGFGKGIMDSG